MLEFIPLGLAKLVALGSRHVIVDVIGHLLGSASITAKNRGNLVKHTIFEICASRERNNLAQVVVGILLKVNSLAAIHESVENALRLGGGKHKSHHAKVKVYNEVFVGKLSAILGIGIEDREQRHRNVLG